MKVSIVGCGAICPTHIDAVKAVDGARVISVADCVPQRAEAAAQQCGAVPFSCLEDMLEAQKPDVLHICTPHALHVPMAVFAMRRGVNVLCEKPCAITAQQLEELRRCQLETGMAFGVCFQNRYNLCAQRLKSFAQSGEYGRLSGMRAIVTWRRDSDYYSSGEWRGTKAIEGGGVLINQAIHTLDLMDWIGGGISAVTAHTSNDHLAGEIEVEDTVSVFAEFSGGFRAVFYATTASAVTSPVLIEACFEKKTLRLEGERLYEIRDAEILPMLEQNDAKATGKACWGSGHAALISDFYACIREGRPFALDSFEGGRAVELMLHIYESAAQGRRTEI